MRPFRSRFSFLALALCTIAACRSAPESSVVDEPVPDCPLRMQLEAALRAPDPLVRRAAVRVLGNRGSAASIDVIGELMVDADPLVQMAAIEALVEIQLRGGEQSMHAAQFLARAARGGSSDIRYFAVGALGSCGKGAAGELDTIRACFQDEPLQMQVMAAYAWSEIERSDELQAHVVELLEQNAGGYEDRLLSQLLDVLTLPEHVRLLEKLLVDLDPAVRFRAECARARLEGGKQPSSGQAALEKRWQDENRAAEVALAGASWKRVPREELLARAARARLVLCGEMHEEEGPIREHQRDVLRAFVKEPAFEAVGFEPSVEEAQGRILELARSLGLRTIPLETNWRELGPEDRPGARELEALEAIGTFLGENPKNRMLVLRGESHTLPGGFLVSRLALKPLVILCGCTVNVPLCAGGLHCEGSVFEVGNTGSVYTFPYEEGLADENAALDRFLAAR